MSEANTLIWSKRQFSDLTPLQVYQLAKLRVDVFVVEQHCAYPELDGRDLEDNTIHVFATHEEVPVAYARILTPQGFHKSENPDSPEAVSIGRVVVAKTHRQRGLATALMEHVITYCEQYYPTSDQLLSAQVRVCRFYASLGFVLCSNEYMEDGIAHVDMRRRNSNNVR